MSDLLKFLQEYEKIIDIVQVVFFFVFSIMLYRKTGNIKYLKDGMEKMKFRTQGYNVTEKVDAETGVITVSSSTKSQCFSNLVPVYRLNKVTNMLEKTDEYIDIQEQIESFKETALQSMLEKFMPKLTLIDETADYTNVLADIDMLAETFDIAEEYRDKFGLDDKMSITQVYDHMKSYAEQLKVDLDKIKKGGEESAKETIEESK